MKRIIPIYLIEMKRPKQADAGWMTITAFDNEEDAISQLDDFQRSDFHQGEAEEWEYRIKQVTLIAAD